jgi:glutathione S-transferase
VTDLILYHAVPSRSMTVHWMLEETGADYRIELLSLEKEDHKRPEYLAVNPLGKVPALRHGDTVITETAAICAYLAEAFPQAKLDMPAGSPLRGEYLRWLFFATVTLEPAIIWETLKIPAEIEYEPFAKVEAVAEVLRNAVSEREFIVGDRFTAADVMIGATIMWGTRLMPVLPPHPELIAYWERLEQRAAWQRAQAADQQITGETAEAGQGGGDAG